MSVLRHPLAEVDASTHRAIAPSPHGAGRSDMASDHAVRWKAMGPMCERRHTGGRERDISIVSGVRKKL